MRVWVLALCFAAPLYGAEELRYFNPTPTDDQTILPAPSGGLFVTVKNVSTTIPMTVKDGLGLFHVLNPGMVGRYINDSTFWYVASEYPAVSTDTTKGLSFNVNFGVGNSTNTTVVTGLTWVTINSFIVCTPTASATPSRDEGAEDASIEGLTTVIHTLVAGTGFSVTTSPSSGITTGRYMINCIGVP